MDYLYAPMEKVKFALSETLPARAAGWLRKDPHDIRTIPKTLSKLFIRQ